MPDLLLELFSEEIPARMQRQAAEDLRRLVTNALVDAGLTYEGAVAFANYRRAPGTIIVTHTETPRALRGRGIASELVQGALELIRGWQQGRRRLRVCGGLFAQPSGIFGSDAVSAAPFCSRVRY